MKHNRGSVMRRAHVLRKQSGMSMSAAMKAAWAEAKGLKIVAIPPQRLPLEAAAMGVVALARKVKNARIEIAFHVKANVGLRVTPRGELPMAFVASKELAAGYERIPR